nr:uncharacterized protein LOC122271439 isoform X1 [Parasteatoda tepidariorum]
MSSLIQRTYDVKQNPFGAQKWSLGEKESQKLRRRRPRFITDCHIPRISRKYQRTFQRFIKRSLTIKVKVSVAVALVLLTLIIAVVVVCFILPSNETTEDEKHWLPEFISSSKLGKYDTAAVSTDAAPCAVIGK